MDELNKFKEKIKKVVKKNDSKINNIKAVSIMLKLNSNLSYQEQCVNIINLLKRKSEEGNKKIKYLLENLSGDNLCNILVNVLYDMFNSDSLESLKLDISNKQYKTLIQNYNNNSITSDDKKKLDKALNIKFCKCIKHFYLNETFDNIINDTEIDKNKKYAICTNSIYKKRNIEVPSKVSYSCREKFKELYTD